MKNPLADKNIVLCVTGSIACYKAADLASKLTQAGARVDVLLTEGAEHFVTPLTFQSVTGRRAFTDADLWGNEAHVLHVGLGHSTHLVLVAPATANTIARLAHGIADNLVSVTALAARCPLVVAPAMDGGMFSHPATQANLEILRSRRAVIIGPASGHLASGLTGVGRMVEPNEILGAVRWLLGKTGPLAGRNVVVTAGGTQEPVDPVRTLTNRSSGKQGFSLAQAALDLGAEVTLICAPVHLPTPYGAQRIDVGTAGEMLGAVQAAVRQADALLMAAAVADFRPEDPPEQKIKKGGPLPTIQLTHTPDILKAVAAQKSESGYPRVSVGFAAESQDLLNNARAKLESKKLDLIVANDITAADAGFGVDTNRVILIDRAGGQEALPLMSKDEVAGAVLERVTALLADHPIPIAHICPRPAWENAKQAGEYRAASLETEGFIHCSHRNQLLATANRYYPGKTDLVLLWIDTRKLESGLRWELAGEQVFPHIYGPLNLDAVSAAIAFEPGPDGAFTSLPAGE